jgi:hypothetical protein
MEIHDMKHTLKAVALLASVTGAYAGDLPSRKAEPTGANYVKVCDAQGSGFFYIPGTDTCLKIGGMVRSDTVYVPGQDLYKITSGAKAIGTAKSAVNTTGWDLRARLDIDARTQTEYGTIQTVISTRVGRNSGTIAEVAQTTSGTQSASTTTPILEAAYIRFAGITAGSARDNFQFMPANIWGAQHWASFIIAPKQLAYTYTFGNGFSATVAVQDSADTAVSAVDAVGSTYYNKAEAPQFNARLQWDQSWGTVAAMGAYRKANGIDATGLAYDKSKDVYALGGGVKINLPMLANGDALWLTGAYADGMTEYTTAYGSNKLANWKRDGGGFVTNQPSVVYYSTGIETVKSWSVGGLLTHWWAPQWRSNVFASYGAIQAPTSAKAKVYDGKGGFGDAKMWSVGQNISWVPSPNFEIGLETTYSKMDQDVRYTLANASNKVVNESNGNWTARARVERRF